jgi:hypothetical protein
LVNFLFILAFWLDDALVSTIDFLHLDDWSGSPSSASTTFFHVPPHLKLCYWLKTYLRTLVTSMDSLSHSGGYCRKNSWAIHIVSSV